MIQRPRRNRLNPAIRGLVRESMVSPANLVWPAFVQEGNNLRSPIVSMPGISRLSIDQLVADCHRAFDLGIPAVALFPALDDSLKKFGGQGKPQSQRTAPTGGKGIEENNSRNAGYHRCCVGPLFL